MKVWQKKNRTGDGIKKNLAHNDPRKKIPPPPPPQKLNGRPLTQQEFVALFKTIWQRHKCSRFRWGNLAGFTVR
jgi:hypothetical protein